MLDSQEELQALLGKEAARVNDINEQRRHAATHASEVWEVEVIKPSFYRSLQEMAVVMNLQYATGLRKSFERSVTDFVNVLEKAQMLLEEFLEKPLRENDTDLTCSDVEKLSHDAAFDRRMRSKAF